MNNLVSEADGKMEEYEVKFKELKSAFQSHAVLQTEIAVLRILGNVEDLGKRPSLCFVSISHLR